MARHKQVQRLFWLGLALSLAFAGLSYRLVDLQVLRHEQLNALAQRNTQREFLFESRRGDILDAKGHLLASSTYVKTVCADPTMIGTRQPEVAKVLAPLLQIPEAKLMQSLTPRPRQTDGGDGSTNTFIRYVRLKRRVPEETWEKVQAAMHELNFGMDEKKCSKMERQFYSTLRTNAIFAENEQIRVYPNQRLAAHVLGYTTNREHEINGKIALENLGADGIEATFEGKLAGVRGWRITETDSHHRELVPLREQDLDPVDGLNVVLTIDSVIQQAVEAALGEAMEKYSPASASAIVVRPRTGEILALASLPNFDPNNLSDASVDARRNRIIADIAEPGSTFKIVVAAGALNDGTVRLTDKFDCEHGHFYYANRMLTDHEWYDTLSVQEIIAKSSNIGAAKIGIKMGETRLYDYIQNFGFGAATAIPLPGEVSARKWVKAPKDWYKVSIAQIPMGQGISVTRMQMTMAMCALANKGVLMRPMLVDRLESRDRKREVKYFPQTVRRVVSEATAKSMVTALKSVVSPDGTAPKAAMEHYVVAGKTGTAQKVENGHYVHDKFFSSFIGFFPADNPELCISVTLDDPDKRKGYYGGQTAAPIFKQIAQQAANYLNIRPDDGTLPSGLDDLASPPGERPLNTAAKLQ